MFRHSSGFEMLDSFGAYFAARFGLGGRTKREKHYLAGLWLLVTPGSGPVKTKQDEEEMVLESN